MRFCKDGKTAMIGKLAAFVAIMMAGLLMQSGWVIADSLAGQPMPWQMGLAEPAAPIMYEIRWLHDRFLLPVIAAIVAFVLFLLGIVIIRFNRRFNPVPSRRSHHVFLEVVWTVVPVLILAVILVPSLRLLYLDRTIPKAALTLKATGHQWYWSYEYPDHGRVIFDSVMIEESDLKPNQLRLLSVDNEVVVPVGQVVRLIVTASDVIHSWAMPAFGTKIDAIPGRLNESWFKADRVGVYYGQCSELCGVRHAFMPIAVRVVEQVDFDMWVLWAKEQGVEAANAMLAERLGLMAESGSDSLSGGSKTVN